MFCTAFSVKNLRRELHRTEFSTWPLALKDRRRELLNSDATIYWGSGMGNAGGATAEAETWNSRPFSMNLSLPPLCALFFKGA